MNVAWLISWTRTKCGWLTTNQISDPTMLLIADRSYKELYKVIVNLDKNYFWDRRTANLVANQYEYSTKKPTAWVYGIFKPENLRIKYTATGDFIDVFLTDWDVLTETPEWYAVNQSTEEPFAIITDNKYIHIFPTPTVNITWWLIIEWAKQPYDLTISTTEDEILIDPIYHDTLISMMIPLVRQERLQIDKKNDALVDSEREVQKALRSMWLLKTKVIRCKKPNLTNLE